jgi:pimeloyl-ACP methyl ester carboxylesterase
MNACGDMAASDGAFNHMRYADGYWWSNDGLRLHYRDYHGPGERPPILCLPGLTRNARDFANLAERLSPEWRVIALDFRGRGESAYAKDPITYAPLTYVQDVERLLTELDLSRCILFGTSLNDIGPVIEPDGLARIRSYVGRAGSWPTWVHAARALGESNAAIYPSYKLEDWLAMAKRLYRLTAQGRVVPDYDKAIAEPFRLPGGEAGVDLWPACLALKDAPLLIVRGQNSDILTAATATEMEARLPDAALVTVSGVGHAPTLDEPAAITAIDHLLARISK